MPTRPRFPQCGARCRGAESGVVSVWESRGRLGVERCWWRIAPEAHGGAAEKGSTRQSSGVSPVSGGGGGEHLDMSSSKSERPCRKRMSPFVRLFGMCVCYGVVQTPVRPVVRFLHARVPSFVCAAEWSGMRRPDLANPSHAAHAALQPPNEARRGPPNTSCFRGGRYALQMDFLVACGAHSAVSVAEVPAPLWTIRRSVDGE